ncbi:MAG: hypothetical protein ACKOOF_12045 [Planctomycetaceae bacterium]
MCRSRFPGFASVFCCGAAVAFCLNTPCVAAADAGGLAGSGVTVAPGDAAFFSATLRAREQFDAILASNAYKSIRALPGLKRALESLEEQRTMPGSPLAMIETFMQLPENEQALDLLRDMVSADTFVYGEPSCVPFVRLARRLQQVQQAAGMFAPDGVGVDFDFEIPDQDELEDEDDDEAAAPPAPDRIVPVRLADAAEEFAPEQLHKRLVAEALVANAELIVVPDVVWGFKTTKREAGASQLKRLEVLAKLVVQSNPDLADSLARTQIGGGEFVTFTLDGSRLPWGDLREQMEDEVGDVEGLDAVFDRLEALQLVIAVGVIDDWVILSLGDSADHLRKLVIAAGKPAADGPLLDQKPFAPLLAHKDRKITGINYISGDLAAALADWSSGLESQFEAASVGVEAAGYPADAAEAFREWLGEASADLGKRLTVPGPWMSYSFLADQGYEGYAWDWSRNQPVDGGKRLDLFAHTGGAPLAVGVVRFKSDPALFDDLAAFVSGGLDFLRDWGLPGEGDEAAELFAELDEHFVPLGEKLVAAIRGKILPSLADGQVGFVIDAKSKAKKPHRDLPSSAEPLPLVEPAIVLPLADAKLFREGLNDLFALTDELVDAVREMNPDAVPAGYRVPDPEKSKAEGGTVWSFAMPESGISEQIRPSIGVGEKAAVFSLAPNQAARMLVANKLETGSGLSTFEEPLAAAAAIDFAGLVDAVAPWFTYGARYASVSDRESGQVDPDEELAADDENEQAKEVLQHAAVVIEAIKCLRAAVAEMSFVDDASVTHWRNVIRDLPK